VHLGRAVRIGGCRRCSTIGVALSDDGEGRAQPAKSGGLIAAGSIIGPIIPPSIGFIIFGVAAGLSISKLFLAGIFPGILIGVGLAIAWWLEVRKENTVAPPKATFRRSRPCVVDGVWALVLPGIIIFGLKFGIFTPPRRRSCARSTRCSWRCSSTRS
jgi:TRAP-type C4-dicarboxylate transport system permease large subunit